MHQLSSDAIVHAYKRFNRFVVHLAAPTDRFLRTRTQRMQMQSQTRRPPQTMRRESVFISADALRNRPRRAVAPHESNPPTAQLDKMFGGDVSGLPVVDADQIGPLPLRSLRVSSVQKHYRNVRFPQRRNNAL